MSNQPFYPQTAFSEGPKTATCLEASMGRKYNVKVRTKPDGSIYSGHWSAWSDVLTCQTTTDIGKLPLSVTKISVKHICL